MLGKSMCIFDLDDTLDLTDAKLSAEILKLSKLGVNFVIATGRTNSYVIDKCRKNNIMPPKFIISDNGGIIYDNVEKKYIRRVALSQEKRKAIIEEFIRLGGALENIRYTDGDYTYAVEDEAVRKYYKKENGVVFHLREGIIPELLKEDSDVTKIILVGKRDMMKELIEFINEGDIKCFPDGGNSIFPERARNNYRVDITDGETSKGEAVEYLINYTGINNFTCIGNGSNDFSMFKIALDHNMNVVVVRTQKQGKLTKESKKLIERVQDYAKTLGRDDNVAVTNFPANGFVGKVEERKSARQRRNTFVDGIRTKTTIRPVNPSRINQYIARRIQDRGSK